jgi:Uma2 family endonuclease
MGVLAKTKWTAAEFLDWSASQTKKFELEDGHVIEMAAEQARHALTKHAATKALEAAVERAGLDCVVFPDGMTVVIDNGHVRLPDAAVQCSPFDPESIVLDKPVILLEVTSPSSVYRDENHKLIEYFSIPSVAHYLLLSPDKKVVVHFKRGDRPGAIETTILSDGMIELSPPGIRVGVKTLFGEVDR